MSAQTEIDLECKACGAALHVESHLRTALCPYCASPSVVDRPPQHGRPLPTFALGSHAAYLYCAAGILQSEAGEALLGKAGRLATTRNWATVLKLQALAATLQGARDTQH